MRLSMGIDYAGDHEAAAARVVELESAGLDMVWVAEAYGFDGVASWATWRPNRRPCRSARASCRSTRARPTLIAMTAAGLDALSGGRCHPRSRCLGPQVIEGWYGVRYDKPLGRTREIVDICRQGVEARGDARRTKARSTTLPLPEGEGTGLGKPLKIIAHPVRATGSPIYVAVHRREERRAHRGDRRRLAAAVLRPREGEGGLRRLRSCRQARREPRSGPARHLRGRARRHRRGGGRRCGADDLARPMPRCTSAGWARRAGITTTRSCSATATRHEAAEIQDLYLAGKQQEAEAVVPDGDARAHDVWWGPRATSRSGWPPTGRPGSPCSASRRVGARIQPTSSRSSRPGAPSPRAWWVQICAPVLVVVLINSRGRAVPSVGKMLLPPPSTIV